MIKYCVEERKGNNVCKDETTTKKNSIKQKKKHSKCPGHR